MKKTIIVIFLLIHNFNYSQNIISEDNRIENFIQIWGLLKYKHPNISKGPIDFDKEFIKQFDKIKTIKTIEQFNTEILNWIGSLNSKKERIKIKKVKSDISFIENADYSWITSSNFNNELTELLNQIKNNTNFGKHYAYINKMSNSVNFNNDKEFIDFDTKKESHRFLFLASFWNKMRYWNVNIYLTETKWNKVLQLIIPNFSDESKMSFDLAKEKLFTYLNDSHSNYNFSKLYNNPQRKYSLYGGRIINDTLVIKTIFNQEFSKSENVQLGDMIYSVNGKKLSEYYKEKFSKRISASNKNYLKKSIEQFYLLSNISDSIKIGLLKKNGEKGQQKIKLYKFSKEIYNVINLQDSLADVKWKKLEKNIGYINLKEINKSELEEAFKNFNNSKGIIIDLRNYPRNLNVNDVPSYLYPKKKVFMKILTPYAPSISKYDTQSVLKIIKNPFAAGKNNKNYYKGKVILLVDRSTSSMAEYFGMAIQNSPNCITIGEQTFGAVMNRNEVILKDKTTIDFTGVGAFYPNDKNVQRQGLKIDYFIQEYAKGYNAYRYIDEAIKLIKKE